MSNPLDYVDHDGKSGDPFDKLITRIQSSAKDFTKAELIHELRILQRITREAYDDSHSRAPG